MIEIKCTEEQKEIIIDKFLDAGGCNLGTVTNNCGEITCLTCIEQNIKWDIQPEPLKPCPCCGGEAEFVHFANEAYVKCKSCHLQTIEYTSEKQAAEIWNRRTTS